MNHLHEAMQTDRDQCIEAGVSAQTTLNDAVGDRRRTIIDPWRDARRAIGAGVEAGCDQRSPRVSAGQPIVDTDITDLGANSVWRMSLPLREQIHRSYRHSSQQMWRSADLAAGRPRVDVAAAHQVSLP
jgi:hypothetical protein